MALLIAVALTAVAVILAPLSVRLFDRRAGWPLAAFLIAAAVVIGRELPAVFNGEPVLYRVVWARDLLGPGTEVAFSLNGDGLGVFFALLALIIGAVVFIYSAAYLPVGKGNISFYTIMTAFTLSVLLLVLSNDAVVLFIAWELVSIASFMLIARSGSSGEAGSYRTLALTFIGGLTLLAALALASVNAGTTNLQGIFASDVWAQDPGLTTIVAVLIATSAFTKAAQFPFHFWLPEAMAAATPVSAFLHAAAVVKAGIYLLLRFSTIFHDVAVWNTILIVFGLGTALISAAFAITKTDLKQLTAYSTVSHLGWIVATIGVGTQFALAAAVVHTLAHALFKSSLFMLIGVVDHQAGSRDIRRLGKLYDKMPFTFTSVLVAAASMAAVPPLFGFVSKEGMLGAFMQAPASGVLVTVAGIAAFLTFVYSAKIVFGAFVDGPRDMSGVKEAPVSLWLPAALPGWMSLVLIFFLAQVNTPVESAVHAITRTTEYESHLAVWHGINTAFIVSMIVLAAGIAFLSVRKPVWDALENKELLPASGNDVLHGLARGMTALGRGVGAMANTFNPSRHLVWLVLTVIALGMGTLFLSTGIDGMPLADRAPGLDNWWDIIPFAIITISVIGLVTTRHRLAAAVLIGTAGVGMSLQMLLLGAPDVALTQFLVESLTVVVIMMVVRYQPRLFPDTNARRKAVAAIIAILAGITAFLGVFTLLGRRERSELAMWYINEGGPLASADNIVAVIIVEFRGFDTLGELSVLGMAAVVIAAVTSSMPRHRFEKGLRPRPFGQSQLNSIPLRKLIKLIWPVLIVLSILVFYRGHQLPGGGFVAALILATGFALSYISKGADGNVVGKQVPIWLTGIGIIVAISAGFLGYIEGGFLYAIHGTVAGEHLTTSLIFDAGIYMAVLGMLTMAINALGGYLRPGVDPSELSYTRGDPANPLPKVPEPEEPENVAPDYPEPINPADNPVAVSARAINARGETTAHLVHAEGERNATPNADPATKEDQQ
ncbi:DUF4040 family protein [Corynebacterium cystitidis]|uniref:Multisubunit sodium/proton antiporter, MrpA subunit (TC 2.A.63.1)/multisubunit sodium/proton antiporter, MrpB subunit (TC 2.A.63.1) n=1 Tax=Corynebacterium cystitidis DSM 20524 TaxID=1121357 RepID=A0A1H9UAB9_9CORY|nr:DUF4040 family protein [Corynebacterium cystitidis]WJY81247.1 Na(+)/H(+) antiporter subunit A [Corynebacterium cystitidis DSM 20524]SES06107.1 multisubunit sodium/proton antiporter, MrpA subunit (TC 2.A.63.1)/multisubunit sodium/proton antiporter, MrpB subunit (TC 2.A.63.1) [Corynebacterium cystitidis DSM 20524]SNV88976.1 monovalent cation/H+ antiporter subunit A [Corynebacterium cystitidis]